MKDSKCTGWWEQYGRRREMEALRMSVEQNQIFGSGIDLVGTFIFRGTISEEGRVRMTKTYLGQHAVVYMGYYDGKSRMQGDWKVIGMKGYWEISMKIDTEEQQQAKERASKRR